MKNNGITETIANFTAYSLDCACSVLECCHKVYSGDLKRDSEKKLPVYSLNDVVFHDTYSDCWIVLYDKIYDVTKFLEEHPGGSDIILENAGRDATIAFRGVGHSQDALSMLEDYLIGVLQEKERVFTSSEGLSRWSIV